MMYPRREKMILRKTEEMVNFLTYHANKGLTVEQTEMFFEEYARDSACAMIIKRYITHLRGLFTQFHHVEDRHVCYNFFFVKGERLVMKIYLVGDKTNNEMVWVFDLVKPIEELGKPGS